MQSRLKLSCSSACFLREFAIGLLIVLISKLATLTEAMAREGRREGRKEVEKERAMS